MHSVHSMTEMCPYVSVDVRKYVLWQTYVFTDTIRKPGFDATLFHVGFVVDKVTLRQVFLRVRRCSWDQDSVVGMATCYRLYGSWLEPHWGARVLHTGNEAHTASCKTITGALSWRKVAGAWRWPITPSSVEMSAVVPLCLHGMLRGDLYLYFGIAPHQCFILTVIYQQLTALLTKHLKHPPRFELVPPEHKSQMDTLR